MLRKFHFQSDYGNCEDAADVRRRLRRASRSYTFAAAIYATCAESTRSCMDDRGSSLTSSPSSPSAACGDGSLSCIESGISSGVMARVISGRGSGRGVERVVDSGSAVIWRVRSGFGPARKDFAVGLRGLSSFSRTESRLRWTFIAGSMDCPNPWDVATCSIDLKYCLWLALCMSTKGTACVP